MKNKKQHIENSQTIGSQIGGIASQNVQAGTHETIQGMKLFEQEIARTTKVGFDQKKGNLFEYIEAAKFNRNAANAGVRTRAVVTAADGRPHAPADIELQNENEKVIREVQAKFCDTHNQNGTDTSAASTIVKQKDKKYRGMQRLSRKEDEFYTDPKSGKKMSFLEREKQLADVHTNPGNVYAEDYKDVSKNLTDELTDESTGITSGGTTLEEMKFAANDSAGYAKKIRLEQYGKEIKTTTANVASMSAISTGIVSGVTNAYEVLKGEQNFSEAAKNTLIDAGKSGAKGAAQGAIGAGIRIAGENIANQSISAMLSNSSTALVLAGGIVDCGVSVFDFIRGEIDAKQMLENLGDTTIKSATTVYFTHAAVAIFGAVNPILTMAVYSVANYVLASTKEIIKNAELNAAEYERAAALNYEMIKMVQQYRSEMLYQINSYQENYRASMKLLLDNFEYAIVSGDNVDCAIYSIISFADQTGIALQHTDFNEFCDVMNSDEVFVLK